MCSFDLHKQTVTSFFSAMTLLIGWGNYLVCLMDTLLVYQSKNKKKWSNNIQLCIFLRSCYILSNSLMPNRYHHRRFPHDYYFKTVTSLFSWMEMFRICRAFIHGWCEEIEDVLFFLKCQRFYFSYEERKCVIELWN